MDSRAKLDDLVKIVNNLKYSPQYTPTKILMIYSKESLPGIQSLDTVCW